MERALESSMDAERELAMSRRVNLRSDTQTLLTEAMLEAMSGAELGDDTYREDPTVIRLEERVADLLAMETSGFLSTNWQRGWNRCP